MLRERWLKQSPPTSAPNFSATERRSHPRFWGPCHDKTQAVPVLREICWDVQCQRNVLARILYVYVLSSNAGQPWQCLTNSGNQVMEQSRPAEKEGEVVKKLKPCPWDGDGRTHNVRCNQHMLTRQWEVYCDCGASGKWCDSEEEAIATWNARAPRRKKVKS